MRYAGLSEDYCTECSDGILYNSEEIVEFIEKVFEKSMKKMTIDDMIFNPTLFDDIVFVHTDGNNIDSIKGISVDHLCHDEYKVKMYDYPITKYTYEQIKQLGETNIKKQRNQKYL